ncbi:Transcriptional regulator YqjI [Corynebacterium atrinae]|uniref:PadR family transcriptional regulator n=1 Tax=Corynebacterium atrinae TaxID=1336740 RepID=UPI0025B44A23|nr:PadR family transcriptional regulator [Corynebacterium atrinae]WJY62645.1 Transcriptional regulator YqjI [Corynebacterium atrinae]
MSEFHHHHPHSHHEHREHRGRGGRRHGRGRGGRAGRGDLKNVILSLLAEQPMHGYQIIATIAERTEQRWTPSAGAIYPRLAMLEDEGLITITVDNGRKMATLTDLGRETVDKRTEDGDILDAYRDPEQPGGPHSERRAAFRRLKEAVRGTDDDNTERIVEILQEATDKIEAL